MLRYLTRRVAGYLVIAALIAVMSFFGMGRAHAQSGTCTPQPGAYTGWSCTDKGTAYAKAAAYTDNQGRNPTARCVAQYGAGFTGTGKDVHASVPTTFQSRIDCRNPAGTLWAAGFVHYEVTHNNQCPAGSTWDDAAKTCHNPQDCLSKNDVLSASIQTTAPSTNGCHQGCATSMGTDYVRTFIVVNGMEATAFRGQARFTGASCITPTKPPEDQEPECFPIEGQTVCKRASDGKICAKSASSGEFFCWGPGETGVKESGPDSQVRKPGTDTTPPPPVLLPNGDTSNPVGNPITTNETKPGVPGTPATNTTINNFTTVNGTSPAPDGGAGPGDGEGGPTGPGTGTGSEGDGEEGDKGTVTGGDTCGSAPVITGGDPLIAAGIMQTWRMRCDGKDDAAKTEFDATVAAGLLNAGENAPEGFSSGASGDWGGATGTWADGDDPFAGARIEEDESDLLGKLKEDAWFGTGGQCPVLPSLNVGAISLPLQIQAICDLLSALSGVILAVAYLRAFRIMAGS